MSTNHQISCCHYHYDPLDRLVDCAWELVSTQRFYLKDRLANELQGAQQLTIAQHENQILAQQTLQNGIAEATLLATDQQRSVLNALNTTDSRVLAYSPYGHRHSMNGMLSLLGFNGERPDPVTGHYLLGNGYRAFNPVLMRFNSPDSWSPFGKGGINAYAYCSGNPNSYRDPTGHSLISVLSTITFSTKSSVSGSWRIIPKNLAPSAMIKNMDQGLLDSITKYQPTTKRVLTSADNAIRHAKLIKYRGNEVDSLIQAREKLSTHISNEQRTIERIQSDVSYDSNSSGPTLIEASRTKYVDVLESQSLTTIQKTFDLNKKLIEKLKESATKIRTGLPESTRELK